MERRFRLPVSIERAFNSKGAKRSHVRHCSLKAGVVNFRVFKIGACMHVRDIAVGVNPTFTLGPASLLSSKFTSAGSWPVLNGMKLTRR